MNKNELEQKIKDLERKIKDLENNNRFLLSQQKTLKHMCEKVGSEVAGWRHKCIRAESELEKIKNLGDKPNETNISK